MYFLIFFFFSGAYFFQMIKLYEIINKHTYTHSYLFKCWIVQTRTLSKEWEGEISLVNYRLPYEITIDWFVSKSIKKISTYIQSTSIFSTFSTTFVITHFLQPTFCRMLNLPAIFILGAFEFLFYSICNVHFLANGMAHIFSLNSVHGSAQMWSQRNTALYLK